MTEKQILAYCKKKGYRVIKVTKTSVIVRDDNQCIGVIPILDKEDKDGKASSS